MKLVRYECGCVGFYPPFEDKKSLILDYCGSDNGSADSLGPCEVEVRVPDTHEELSEEKLRSIFKRMAELMGDGYRFREIKRLLEVK